MISQCIRIGVMKDIPFWTKLFCSRHLLSAGPPDLAGCTVWTMLRVNCHHNHRHNHQKNDWNPQDLLRLRLVYVFGRSPTAGNSQTWDQGCSGAFLPVRDFKGGELVLSGPCGCLKGPRVGSNDSLWYILSMWNVLRSFGASQGSIWGPRQFHPMEPSILAVLRW